ncbi:efflux RND transporter periplasmic adaptor subunit [Rosenbergiella australiborealis]|uniref:Efflux RND transporter periplasmic adaptor subunit n=1 Tax=Rosenbergiella australiborealis TaxID=1544696 RepID=A0ABS5T865_9GAMM|nr:efflux RND transporter periplasmic adaptor subunit [Rosenbergiella australiborealis]MBT0727138.1 efflux RND transporter periplasmic adaptor subunit [Rosenbergiella australiborealis]
MTLRHSLLCVTFFLSACDNASQTPSATTPLNVSVETVVAQPVTIAADLPGRVSSAQEAEVRPQVGGIVIKRLFKEGTNVEAGQPLYLIDPSTYQAALEKANAKYSDSQRIYQRYQRLAADQAISQQDLQTAQSTYLQAKADRDTAKINLAYTQVRASLSGRIGRSSLTPGALVTANQSTALATITQLNPMYVDITESASDLLRLRRALRDGQLEKVGDNMAGVKLSLEDGSEYPLAGQLAFSEVNVNEGTGSVTLRAIFPNPEAVLLPGMFVRATLKQGVAQKGIVIPQRAILRDSRDLPYVYLINKANKVVQQSLTLGQMQQGQWQVTQGLQEGDRIALDHLQDLSPGATVSPQPASASPPTSPISLSMTDKSAQ